LRADRITLLVASMDAGGTQRALSMMADHWVGDGRSVRLVTLSSTSSDFYVLDPSVDRVGLDLIGPSSGVSGAITANASRLKALRRAMIAGQPDCIISFGDTANCLALLANLGTGIKLIVSERNDPRRLPIGASWAMIVSTPLRHGDRPVVCAIADNGPVVVMEHKFLGSAAKGQVPEGEYTVPIGRAEVVRRGSDVTLVGIGRMTHVCLEAAERLAAEGTSAEVVDLLTLAPLDEATVLESVSRTHRLVVVDEDTPTASMARDIAARVADKGFDWLDAPIKTVTAPAAPVPFAAVLEALYAPQAANVVAAVDELFG
jgi:hypothetical protein